MSIVDFDEVVAFIGEFVRLSLKEDISGFTQYEEIQITDGMNAIIQEINTNTRTMKIKPINAKFPDVGDTITGQSSSETATVMVSEATFMKNNVDQAKNFIENYTGKLFGSTEQVTEEFSIKADTRYYWVEKRPLVSVDTVVVDDVTQTEDTNYYVDLTSGMIDFGEHFLSDGVEPFTIEITYTHGEATVPQVVKQAAILYIEHFWKKRNHNESMKGASSMNFGGRSIGWTQQGNFAETMEQIKQILAPIAKIRFESY